MKNYIIYILLTSIFLNSSCTDVIDVEVPTEPARLVVEASIDWRKGSAGNSQKIKLSLSTPYFENLVQNPVSGAFVKIVNDNDKSEIIFEDQNDGIYKTDNFVPSIGQSYTLEVIYDGETYIAKETMTAVAAIENVYQSTGNGFDKNALEVNINWYDPLNETNFYLTKFKRRGDAFQTMYDLKDEFTNGNEMNIMDEKMTNEDTGEIEYLPGDVVDISLLGISERYFNYIRLLIEQSGRSGDIFGTIPAEIKGNCINISQPEKYAFGYFRLSEVDQRVYTFE